MTNEELKNAILRRLYEIVFHEGREGILSIREFSASNKIDLEQAFKVIDELKESGFIEDEWAGGTYVFSPAALFYCEEQKLADPKLIDYQRTIRTKLLITLAAMQEKSPSGEGVDWQGWLRQANVSDKDFTNNQNILQRLGWIKYDPPSEYIITSQGMKVVKELNIKTKRLDDFIKMKNQKGITPQQRGHKLEDLLADIIREEGWEVDIRVRAPGQEIDIIIHKGMDYLFISCKWEADPIQPKELDEMYARALSRKDIKGSIIVSISGFMDNCVNEAIRKMENCHLIMFGHLDINKIFSCEKTFTSLLEEKYKEIMLHRRILLDGKVRDVQLA